MVQKKSSLRKIMVALGLVVNLLGCGEVNNSSSLDADIYGANVTGSAAFLAARYVLSSQCFRCHGSWASYNESQFVSNGLVVARNASSSSLYTSIRGNDTGIAGNMPVGATNLTSEEISTIKSWISAM